MPAKGGSAVQYVDPAKVNYAVASRWLATQSTGGGNRMFAGRQLRFDGKKGGYSEYVNKQNKRVKNTTFVLNVPNTYAAWQYWPENEGPSYPAVIAPYQNEDAALPSRAMMGPPETKYNKLKKEDEDVYNEAVVFILRNPDTDDIYHWVGVKSQKNAMIEFLQDNNDEFARRKGKLPVVELGTEEIELKDGGSYEKPTITIVDWVKPGAMDNPQGLAASIVEESDGDEDDEPVKASVKSRSAAKSKSRDEDDDEDGDEEEEDDEAPTTRMARQKNEAKRAAARKAVEEDDDDEEEDEDEDDEPVRGARKKGKAVVASKRKVVAADDDDEEEDEDDEPAPRRRGR